MTQVAYSIYSVNYFTGVKIIVGPFANHRDALQYATRNMLDVPNAQIVVHHTPVEGE